MADFDMEMESAVRGVFIGITARREPQRQWNPQHAPAPHHEAQFSVIQHERHSGAERPEALAHQPFETPASLLLRAVERTSREDARPALASVLSPELDLDRHILAGPRKADHRGRD